MRSPYLLAYAIAVWSAICPAAWGDFSYSDFSDTSGLRLNSDARVVGNQLQLTSTTPFSAGSVFTASQVGLGNINTFSTRFQFQITNSGGITDEDGQGADGFAFVVQTVSSSVGGAGAGIGYQGINPSLVIEFDTYNNGGIDPNGNHVGVNVNGNLVSLVTATVPTRFNNGQVWSAWIDYDGAVSRLDVRWSMTDIRPMTAQLSAMINLQQILSSNSAFVGFTSATGSAWNNHNILNWEYSQTLGADAIPEPASAILFGLGVAGAGIVGIRRRR